MDTKMQIYSSQNSLINFLCIKPKNVDDEKLILKQIGDYLSRVIFNVLKNCQNDPKIDHLMNSLNVDDPILSNLNNLSSRIPNLAVKIEDALESELEFLRELFRFGLEGNA